MAYDYIRRSYGVDPRPGARVTVDGKPGVIVRVRGDPAHIQVRFDGRKHSTPCHPTWKVDYAPPAPPAPAPPT